MAFYQRGDVRIAYEEAGKGFPLLIIAGGGLNSTIEWAKKSAPFNAMEEFKNEYRCIVTDLRNAVGGQSTGPLEVERPWDSYIDDLLGLMDHLGIKRFMALGYCIGAPYIWGLVKRAPDRVVAAVPAQPVGWNKAHPLYMRELSMKSWAPELMKRDPKVTPDMIEKFLTRMFPNPDWLFTVDRDFVRKCQTPMLILLDDSPGHPYDVAWETAMIAPRSELAHYPWKEPADRFPSRCARCARFCGVIGRRSPEGSGLAAQHPSLLQASYVLMEMLDRDGSEKRGSRGTLQDRDDRRPGRGVGADHSLEMEALAAIGAEIVEVNGGEDELVAAAADADAIYGKGSPRITAKVINAGKKLKVISLASVGVDSVDVDAATALGIPVTNCPDTFIEEVADHAMTLILASCRRLVVQDQMVRKGDWAKARPMLYQFPRLMGMTLGFISFGHVARAVAKRAAPFGFQMLAYDPYIEELVMSDYGVQPVGLDELLQRSDIISMHAPGTKDAHHLMKERTSRR